MLGEFSSLLSSVDWSTVGFLVTGGGFIAATLRKKIAKIIQRVAAEGVADMLTKTDSFQEAVESAVGVSIIEKIDNIDNAVNHGRMQRIDARAENVEERMGRVETSLEGLVTSMDSHTKEFMASRDAQVKIHTGQARDSASIRESQARLEGKLDILITMFPAT